MKQFILGKEPDKGIVRLEGADYHYLVKVRRLAAGERFPALLPNGEETLIQIISIDKNILTGKCITDTTIISSSSSAPPRLCERSFSSPKIPPIILFQALPKGEKMDLIVRQAAEGGITEIVPFVSEFSVAKTGRGGQKFSRWERIIKEARQQSGSKIATAIREPLTISGLFDYWKTVNMPALGLLFHHQGLENESLHSYLNNNPKVVVLAVGPEGGFSDRETGLFLGNGFKPITIGDTILRTETAALYFSAAVRILLLEGDSWQLKTPNSDNV
uniref:Ribosomal RNA small subunit methyltransferase E n=1 Tax=uncultured bacterium contig00043 TaxID=1181530 RepID=A0A806KDG0_9BACT|nr:ribosomal RNA small subunit methyltransferase E [uncultured bacterium contig00043]